MRGQNLALFRVSNSHFHLGGKQVKKERRKKWRKHFMSVLCKLSIKPMIQMQKETFRCRYPSDLYRNHRLQAENISVSFPGPQKDLLLQELPKFPDCDRHHYSLHAVLCMHPPMPLFTPYQTIKKALALLPSSLPSLLLTSLPSFPFSLSPPLPPSPIVSFKFFIPES